MRYQFTFHYETREVREKARTGKMGFVDIHDSDGEDSFDNTSQDAHRRRLFPPQGHLHRSYPEVRDGCAGCDADPIRK